jgi:hypothetical protein
MRMPVGIRYEKLPANGLRERDIADVDRDDSLSAAARQLKTPLLTGGKIFDLEVPPADETVKKSTP